jgi:hypothetical protein
MTSGKRGPLDQYFTRTAAPNSKKAKATAGGGALVRRHSNVCKLYAVQQTALAHVMLPCFASVPDPVESL